MRAPLYSTFGSAFGVDMSEAAEEDYRYYPTFNSFFRRALKPGMRPISNGLLVSPADGKVLHVSKCESGYVEQVKGQKNTSFTDIFDYTHFIRRQSAKNLRC